jgi:hypothetical protein
LLQFIDESASDASAASLFHNGNLVQEEFTPLVRMEHLDCGVAGGILVAGGTLILNDTSSVKGNDGGLGGGIFNAGSVTMNDSSSVTGNTTDSVDQGGVTGGGIYIWPCGGALIGGVDGGNVNDNYRGTAAPVEDNIRPALRIRREGSPRRAGLGTGPSAVR